MTDGQKVYFLFCHSNRAALIRSGRASLISSSFAPWSVPLPSVSAVTTAHPELSIIFEAEPHVSSSLGPFKTGGLHKTPQFLASQKFYTYYLLQTVILQAMVHLALPTPFTHLALEVSIVMTFLCHPVPCISPGLTKIPKERLALLYSTLRPPLFNIGQCLL